MSTVEFKTRAKLLLQAKRLVVKVGSALLVDAKSGRLNRQWLGTLAADLAAATARGQQVIVVSSGAIALGRRQLGLTSGTLKLEESQAAAAVGQIRLAHAWKEVFESAGLSVAQMLLTLGDTEDRRRYLNARRTLDTLLKFGAVPVINENDTVATAEIRYGDNDRLAARVAQMASAECLVLFSDVDGLYTADPTSNPEATFVPEVQAVDSNVVAMGSGPLSGLGSGGMATKIAAAKIATAAGCNLCIASGRRAHPLRAIIAGQRCTWFRGSDTPTAVRKQWIAGTLRPRGTLCLDPGAINALRRGKSLLPAGVLSIAGTFDRGDTVSVLDAQGSEIARGLSAYSASDAALIIGRKSRDIEMVLGYRGREELIHRDDLVLLS